MYVCVFISSSINWCKNLHCVCS